MTVTGKASGLKDAWAHSFRVGAAVSGRELHDHRATDILKTHFSSMTSENAMKMSSLQPEENRWNWEEADRLASFARENGIPLRGHTLVWHNQTPDWIFRSGDDRSTRTTLFKRLETHICTVAGRYNDVVYDWDVLNEAIDVEKGTPEGLRRSEWLKIGGKELYSFAFRIARQASPNSRLYYNDYNIEAGAKLEATVRFLSGLLEEGVPIDGVGIQGHWNWEYPNCETLRNAIERYAALGLDVSLTELDISAYAEAEKEALFKAMPTDRSDRQARQYLDIFRVAADYPAVKGITTWGIADNHTWLDNFPVPRRKNWPLLFDTEYRSKDFVPELIDTGFYLTD